MQIPEKFRRPSIESWPLPELLEDTQAVIQNIFDLKLTNIERWNLKNLACEVLKERDRHLEAINWDFVRTQTETFDPCIELTTRFMVDYYHLPFWLAKLGHGYSVAGEQIIKGNYQGFKDYLKKVQDEEHHFTN